jgi:signal transduction histidine kinase
MPFMPALSVAEAPQLSVAEAPKRERERSRSASAERSRSASAERSRSTVHEKKKSSGTGYQPTVTVSTKKMEDHILIAVEDNGNGIPQHILDKIFQPFFTTKPTGQGTGLGLSLSYDIVKAHEGKLEVETEEGAHTIFRIILPNKK